MDTVGRWRGLWGRGGDEAARYGGRKVEEQVAWVGAAWYNIALLLIIA